MHHELEEALGASNGAVLRALLRPTIWNTGLGVVLGVAGRWPAGLAFAGAPFVLQRLDARAYVAAAALFLLTRALAAVAPALLSLRQDLLPALGTNDT